MKKLLLIFLVPLSFLTIADSNLTAVLKVGSLPYYNINPCSQWDYVNDFDSHIHGYICTWPPHTTVQVPDALALIEVIDTMDSRLKALEDKVNELTKQLEKERL